MAEREHVDIRLHSVIYNVTDEMRKAMSGLLEPTFKEVRLGHAEVRQIFKVPKIGTVAGCMVTDGTHQALGRRAGAAAPRRQGGPRGHRSARSSASRTTSSEVKSGFECGLSFERYNDLKVGDVVEVFIVERVEAPVS